MNKFYVWGGDVTDDRLYQMSHSAKIMSDIFYMHAFVRHFGSKCNPRHETWSWREQWRHLKSLTEKLTGCKWKNLKHFVFILFVFEWKNLSKKWLKRTKRFQNEIYLFQFVFLTLLDS
jgi:hypothetical protein